VVSMFLNGEYDIREARQRAEAEKKAAQKAAAQRPAAPPQQKSIANPVIPASVSGQLEAVVTKAEPAPAAPAPAEQPDSVAGEVPAS